jgi:hypothetical protein
MIVLATAKFETVQYMILALAVVVVFSVLGALVSENYED